MMGLLRLHMNESSFGPPSDLLERVLDRRRRPALERYPDSDQPGLRKLYAGYASGGALGEELTPAQVVPANGSDEAIDLVVRFLRPRVKQVVVLPPTFGQYVRSSRSAGLRVVEAPLGAGFRVDLSALAGAIGRIRSAVFLCDPNNPTGNRLDVLGLLRTATALGVGNWVVVDEAYWEFAGGTILPQLRHWPNLIVLRTMSKAFGLASARLGFALASADVAGALDAVRMPFNVGALSAAIGAAALEDPSYVRDVVRAVTAGRDRLAAGLAGLPGLQPYPSETNFVLCRTPGDGAVVAQAMARRGVLIRHYPSRSLLGDCVRITVGTPAEIDDCLRAMAESIDDLRREGAFK